MTRIITNSKQEFRLRDGGRGWPSWLECVLIDDDKRPSLYIDQMYVSAGQCRKLIEWLERAEKKLTGFNGL